MNYGGAEGRDSFSGEDECLVVVLTGKTGEYNGRKFYAVFTNQDRFERTYEDDGMEEHFDINETVGQDGFFLLT